LRVKLSDPALLDELRSALRDGEVASVQVGDDTLLVMDPLGVDRDEARVELAFFVQAWLASRPGVDAEVTA
jgi:hypothetical protein